MFAVMFVQCPPSSAFHSAIRQPLMMMFLGRLMTCFCFISPLPDGPAYHYYYSDISFWPFPKSNPQFALFIEHLSIYDDKGRACFSVAISILETC